MNFQTIIKFLSVNVLNAFYYESWILFENTDMDEYLEIITIIENEINEREAVLCLQKK